MHEVGDPFASQKSTKSEFNDFVLKHLEREILKKSDPETEMKEAREKAERTNRETINRVDVEKAVRSALENSPSCRWTNLERVTLRRVALAIIDLDGIGEGVEMSVANNIASRNREEILSASRKIIAKYDNERGGLDPAIYAVAAEEFGIPIFPETPE